MKTKILGLLAVGLLAGPIAANASLLGQTASCAITPTPLWTCNVASSLIADPGSEFQLQLGSSGYFDVNISASSILMTWVSTLGGSLSMGANELFTLSGLNGISGVSLLNTSGTSGFTVGDLGLGANSISMTLNGSSWGNRATALIGVSVVPEPGTLALLSLGLAGLGLSRRRKAN